MEKVSQYSQPRISVILGPKAVSVCRGESNFSVGERVTGFGTF